MQNGRLDQLRDSALRPLDDIQRTIILTILSLDSEDQRILDRDILEPALSEFLAERHIRRIGNSHDEYQRSLDEIIGDYLQLQIHTLLKLADQDMRRYRSLDAVIPATYRQYQQYYRERRGLLGIGPRLPLVLLHHLHTRLRSSWP